MFLLFEKIHWRWWQAGFWIAWCCATTVMVLPATQLPEVKIWDKAEHTVTFSLLMTLAWLGYRRQCSATRIAALLVIYGIVIESVQHFIPSRSFSLLDMVANAVGILPVFYAVKSLEN